MVNLFAKIKEWQPFLYIDINIYFMGLTFKEHLLILGKILQLIRTSGMQVSANKNQFCQESFKYFGFELDHTSYKPLASQVSAILCINQPTILNKSMDFSG
jgi:hypothetical protein